MLLPLLLAPLAGMAIGAFAGAAGEKAKQNLEEKHNALKEQKDQQKLAMQALTKSMESGDPEGTQAALFLGKQAGWMPDDPEHYVDLAKMKANALAMPENAKIAELNRVMGMNLPLKRVHDLTGSQSRYTQQMLAAFPQVQTAIQSAMGGPPADPMVSIPTQGPPAPSFATQLMSDNPEDMPSARKPIKLEGAFPAPAVVPLSRLGGAQLAPGQVPQQGQMMATPPPQGQVASTVPSAPPTLTPTAPGLSPAIPSPTPQPQQGTLLDKLAPEQRAGVRALTVMNTEAGMKAALELSKPGTQVHFIPEEDGTRVVTFDPNNPSQAQQIAFFTKPEARKYAQEAKVAQAQEEYASGPMTAARAGKIGAKYGVPGNQVREIEKDPNRPSVAVNLANQEEASKEAQRDFIKSSRVTYDALKQAPAALKSIERAIALIPQARGFMGPGGETLLEAAKFLNNRMGFQINTEGVKSAEELRTRIFFNILDNLKKMDAQPSQLQQQIMQESLGKLGTDPNALTNVLRAFSEVIRDKVGLYNQEVMSAERRGIKFPYEPTITLPAEVPNGGAPGAAATDGGWAIRPIP